MRLLAWLVLLAGCGAGAFDRDPFEDIVARVRPLVTEPGKAYLFRVDADLDPSSLSPLRDDAVIGRGDGRGLVRATIDDRHHLGVSIETRDDGHAGEDG